MPSCKVGKEFFLLSPNFQASGFLLPGILYPCILCWLRGSFYLSLLPHNTGFGFRFNSVLIPSWWCAVCSPLPTAPSAGDLVFQPVSLPQGKWLMSHPQGVAPGIGDREDVSGVVLQTGLANLSLLCHRSPHQLWQCHEQPLGIRPFFWSQPCHPCSLYSLVVGTPDNKVKGQRWKYWNAGRRYCWSEKDGMSKEPQRCSSANLLLMFQTVVNLHQAPRMLAPKQF